MGGLDCVSCVSDGLCVCSFVPLLPLVLLSFVCVPPSSKICVEGSLGIELHRVRDFLQDLQGFLVGRNSVPAL